MNGIEDLLDQLMARLHLQDASVREKLREGILQGMSSVSEDGEVRVEFDIQGQPDVVVLDGGGLGGAAEPPDLQVFEGENLPPACDVDVHVFRTGDHVVPDLKLGKIQVNSSDQTVYRGSTPRTYRVQCFDGALAIMLDGKLSDEITAGQSIDVEAAWIQVSGTGSAGYSSI